MKTPIINFACFQSYTVPGRRSIVRGKSLAKEQDVMTPRQELNLYHLIQNVMLLPLGHHASH